MQNILVVIPCYRDSESLQRLAQEIHEHMPSARIMVVNDLAMPDPALEAFSKDQQQIEIVDAPYNLGHQGAIVYGLRAMFVKDHYSDVTHVVTMDADGQDDPQAAHAMLVEAGDEEICVAQRVGDRPEGFAFTLCYALYKLIFQLLVGFRPDYGNYAAMSRTIARQIALSPDFDSIYSMSLHLITPVKRYPLRRRARFDGVSRVRINGLIDHALSMTLPNLKEIAKRLAVLSLATGFILLCFAGLIVMAKIILPEEYVAPNWATIICFGSAMLCFQLFSLCALLFVLAASIRQSASSSRTLSMLAYASEERDPRDMFQVMKDMR